MNKWKLALKEQVHSVEWDNAWMPKTALDLVDDTILEVLLEQGRVSASPGKGKSCPTNPRLGTYSTSSLTLD